MYSPHWRSKSEPSSAKQVFMTAELLPIRFKFIAFLTVFSTVRCTEVRGPVKNRKVHAVHRSRYYVRIRNKGQKVKVTLEQATKDQRLKWRCNSTLSSTSALDRVGGQCHDPAALPPGMTRYPLFGRAGGIPEVV